MNDDAALLRRYAEQDSQAAFTELVQRHVDLVYGAALRRTGGDAHRAADVAQQVFTTLARQARKLSSHTVLAAWLHTATRNAALNLMISEQRRKQREIAAQELEPAAAGSGADVNWEQLRPVLDAAIDELPENDRAAVVLRFLERRPFAEIGATLAVSEDAARMRTDRALDKLRTALARRGITSPAAALAALANQPGVAAPAGLAAVVAAESLATAAAAGGVFAAFAALVNLKVLGFAAAGAVAFFGLGAYLGSDFTASLTTPPPPETSRQAQLIAALRQDTAQLKAEIDRLNAANAKLVREAAARPAPPASPAQKTALAMPVWQQQRMILNNLRQLAAARDQYKLENGRWPASMHDLIGETKYVRRALPLDGEDYYALPTSGQPLVVTTANGVTTIYDPEGPNTTQPQLPPEIARAEELGRKIQPAVNKAFESYHARNAGRDPPDERSLLPYFADAQVAADFVEVMETLKPVK
jgi:RNA polymerase sigma factor (sigma-70 family)